MPNRQDAVACPHEACAGKDELAGKEGKQFSEFFGAVAASSPFTVLHGAGSGILTIARGTVPLAMFGPGNYGYRLDLLGAASRVAMAAAPLLFGILIERYGAGVLVFSSALSAAAFLGLCTLPSVSSGPHRNRD
jgi:hypothetical protein